MSKLLIITGLIMLSLGISRIAQAQDVLVLKRNIVLRAGSTSTVLINSKENDFICFLKHSAINGDVVLGKTTSLQIVSVSQDKFIKFVTDFQLQSIGLGDMKLSCSSVDEHTIADVMNILTENLSDSAIALNDDLETRAENY